MNQQVNRVNRNCSFLYESKYSAPVIYEEIDKSIKGGEVFKEDLKGDVERDL